MLGELEMITITDIEIKQDIERFKTRITKARAKLTEIQPANTRKDKQKAKQLKDEIKHVQKLLDIAKKTLIRSNES